jgi:hypothetical protein
MVIRSPKDFWAGLLFIGLGILAITVGSRYNLGTAARMGPGYFPRILGILLIVLGAIITFRGVKWGGDRDPEMALDTAVDRARQRVPVRLDGGQDRRRDLDGLLIVAASAASHEFRPRNR